MGVPVVHCTAETRDDGRGANRNARLFMGVKHSPVKLSPGSDAVQVPAEIGVDPADIVLARYHGLGPMTGTQLDPMLRNLGVTTIVGVGVSLNIGMTNLAFDAVNRGYQIVLPRDAVAGVPAGYGAGSARQHPQPRRDDHHDRRGRDRLDGSGEGLVSETRGPVAAATRRRTPGSVRARPCTAVPGPWPFAP